MAAIQTGLLLATCKTGVVLVQLVLLAASRIGVVLVQPVLLAASRIGVVLVQLVLLAACKAGPFILAVCKAELVQLVLMVIELVVAVGGGLLDSGRHRGDEGGGGVCETGQPADQTSQEPETLVQADSPTKRRNTLNAGLL